jgi:hypothetical protein
VLLGKRNAIERLTCDDEVLGVDSPAFEHRRPQMNTWFDGLAYRTGTAWWIVVVADAATLSYHSIGAATINPSAVSGKRGFWITVQNPAISAGVLVIGKAPSGALVVCRFATVSATSRFL